MFSHFSLLILKSWPVTYLIIKYGAVATTFPPPGEKT